MLIYNNVLYCYQLKNVLLMIINNNKRVKYNECDIPEDNWLNILSFLRCDEISKILTLSKTHFALRKRVGYDFYTAYALCDKFEITVTKDLSPLDELQKYRKIKKEFGGELFPLVCRILGPTAFEKLPVLSKESITKSLNMHESDIEHWSFYGSPLGKEEKKPSNPIVICEINKIYFVIFNCKGSNDKSLKTVFTEIKSNAEISVWDSYDGKCIYAPPSIIVRGKYKEYIDKMIKEEISLPPAYYYVSNLLNHFKNQYSLFKP